MPSFSDRIKIAQPASFDAFYKAFVSLDNDPAANGNIANNQPQQQIAQHNRLVSQNGQNRRQLPIRATTSAMEDPTSQVASQLDRIRSNVQAQPVMKPYSEAFTAKFQKLLETIIAKNRGLQHLKVANFGKLQLEEAFMKEQYGRSSLNSRGQQNSCQIFSPQKPETSQQTSAYTPSAQKRGSLPPRDSAIRQSKILARVGTQQMIQFADQSVLVYEKARSPVKSLDISGNPIGIDGVLSLVKGLYMSDQTVSGTLQELNIAQTNPFFHASATYGIQLAGMMEQTPILERLIKLDLSANLLGDQAATDLLPSLYSLNQLQQLNISDNHLGDRFIRCLSLSSFSRELSQLDLSKNQFFDLVMLSAKLTIGHRALSKVDVSGSVPCTGNNEISVPSHMHLVGYEGLTPNRRP